MARKERERDSDRHTQRERERDGLKTYSGFRCSEEQQPCVAYTHTQITHTYITREKGKVLVEQKRNRKNKDAIHHPKV